MDMSVRHAQVMQARAYSAWINAQLSQSGHEPVTDLVMDLADGVLLCHLVSAVTGQKVRGFQSKPRTAAHKVANISLALDTADACGMAGADQIEPEEIHDMNTKAVLEFIATLVEHQSVPEAKLTARLSELAGASVANLTTAWSDGLLLAKMIDRKRDKLINPETLDTSVGEKNVGDALYLLETHFKLPKKILTASDIVQTPDQRAMRVFLTFVADAISGENTVGAGIDDGPRVFSSPSASAVSTPVKAATSSVVHSTTSPVSYASPVSYTSPSVYQTTSTTSTTAAVAAPRPSASGASVATRSTPLKNFSQAISSKYPGIKFDAINVDGRSAEGQSPCQQCGGALGDGRCFRFRIPDRGVQLVHSRCFDCAVCRKDFVQGFFYMSDDATQLLCTPHYMETKGETCKSCSEPICDFFVSAIEGKFHETCFKCHGPCGKQFDEPKFFEGPGAMPFCPTCFAASEGRVCKRCGLGVPSPIKALDSFWHDSCFACGICQKPIDASFVAREDMPYHSACLDKESAGSAPAPMSPVPPPASSSSSSSLSPVSPASSHSPNKRGSYSTKASPCKACGKGIPMGKAVTVSGARYHDSCFKCHFCNQKIAGSFFSVAEGFCCPACEHRLPPVVEGGNVPCAKCGKTLVGSVIKAIGKEYHKGCFVCSTCSEPLEGSFHSMNGKPVCAKHAK